MASRHSFALPLRQSQHTKQQRARRLQGPAKKSPRSQKGKGEVGQASDEEESEVDHVEERKKTPPRTEFTAAQLQELETAHWKRGEPFPGAPFPHAPLRERKRPRLDIGESESGFSDLDPAIRPQRDARRVTLKEQFAPRHQFAVMSDILHHSLLEGDIDRASKAFGLLLRTKIGPDYPDITANNYWGVAAEILARRTRQSRGSDDEWTDVEEDGGAEGSRDGDSHRTTPSDDDDNGTSDVRHEGHRLGNPGLYTPDGVRKARELLDILILEYPYRVQQPDRVDARDFFQPMFTLWIYEIQRRSEKAIQPYSEEDEGFDARRRAIKLGELRMARELAMRMDSTLGTFPYDQQPGLWELRGMVALWVGDLECNRYREGANAALWAEYEKKAAKCFMAAERYGGSVWPGMQDIVEEHRPPEQLI